ncbi:MAG: ABC transporter ATP-binding protein [Clostridia bacterium]|nr:ABC transporter ATP-binding protein [Clostridia bacterium]
MRQIFRYIKPYRRKLVLVGLLYLVSTMCSLLMPYLMSSIVNDGIQAHDMGMIIRIGVLMLLLAAMALGCGIWTTRVNSKVSTGFSRDLRNSVFQKINSLSFEEYASIGTSSLLTRATHDIFNIQEASVSFVYVIVTFPVLFIGGAVLAFTSDWLLALVLVALAPLVLLIIWLVTRRMGNLWENSDKYIDMQNKVVRERLSGLRVVRSFDKELHEHRRIEFATKEMAKNIIKANVLAGVINPLSLFLLNIATIAMLYIGAVRIQSEAWLTAGDIIATVQYVALIMNGLLVLSWTFVWLPHLKVCVRRVSEVLALKGQPAEQVSGEVLSGEIKLENVSFSYGDSEQPVLQNIDIDIKNGEIVSIIGGTGSGKTTVMKLLMDFYAPTGGRISMGGRDYSTLSRETVRDNIAIALQKSMIFEGTIEENIKMGKKDASPDELERVAEIAQISDFIHSQENGYSYKLAQAGANISGGQKQRFNIARTIIKPASVYIFDDSFSALDYLTESKLRKELNRYLKGKTQIIVTQRAATAMRCDKVYVMDRGRIVGVGTHEELLSSCPIYKEIYDSQLGGDLNA